jgi:hypothetical protein
LRDHPVWSRLRAFLDAWGDTTLALSSTVDHVWLEFDVSTSAGGTPVPSVFHGYRSVDGVDAVTTATPSRSQLEATCRAFHILSGRPVALAVVEQLGACFEHLPAGARVFQLGAMIARDTDAFRVCVNFLDVSQILPYLDQLGWTGERARLQRLLRQLEGRVDRLALDLDMSTSVLPKVGLECYLIRDDGAQAQRWSPFLDSLVEGGIALEPKCRALLDYPGLADFRRDGARWPAALRRTSELLGSAAISVFWRGIHHVKLVLEPGQPAEAKAYLSVNHRWVTPDLISGRR